MRRSACSRHTLSQYCTCTIRYLSTARAPYAISALHVHHTLSQCRTTLHSTLSQYRTCTIRYLSTARAPYAISVPHTAHLCTIRYLSTAHGMASHTRPSVRTGHRLTRHQCARCDMTHTQPHAWNKMSN
eukprot:3940289-Rhodomonas_salina.2